MALYELAIMGAPSDTQINELAQHLSRTIELFGLELGKEVGWSVCPPHFDPSQKTAAAVVFFGDIGVSDRCLSALLRNGIPVLPVVSAEGHEAQELPEQLKPLNCLTYKQDGSQRIATALLECVGLLPRQRRVFVSYRRGEAREAALQLFDALSARRFDVFLDMHGIAPAEDFQAVLWHRLCDSDVLVMLDTPTYFDSRWTKAEFGRALSKKISILRIGLPGVKPSPHTSVANHVNLVDDEVDAETGAFSSEAIERICIQLETTRSQSQAVRSLNLFSKIKLQVECIGGTVVGVGVNNAIYIVLPDGKEVIAYPTVGVPTSLTLNEAADHAPDSSVAVVYDHIGLGKKWQEHLDWLGENIQVAHWVKADEAAWRFADWEA